MKPRKQKLSAEIILQWLEAHRALLFEVWKKNPPLHKQWHFLKGTSMKRFGKQRILILCLALFLAGCTISEPLYIKAMSSIGCHHILDERSGSAQKIYQGLTITYKDISDFRRASTAENMLRISHIIADRVAQECP